MRENLLVLLVSRAFRKFVLIEFLFVACFGRLILLLLSVDALQL